MLSLMSLTAFLAQTKENYLDYSIEAELLVKPTMETHSIKRGAV